MNEQTKPANCPARVSFKFQNGPLDTMVIVDFPDYGELLDCYPDLEVAVMALTNWEQVGNSAPVMCPIHNVPMKRHQKGPDVWYSHRHEGRWCRGK